MPGQFLSKHGITYSTNFAVKLQFPMTVEKAAGSTFKYPLGLFVGIRNHTVPQNVEKDGK